MSSHFCSMARLRSSLSPHAVGIFQLGIWGRMHKDYLAQYHPALYNELILSGKLWIYLADLNEQAQNRLDCIIAQMKEAKGITGKLKSHDPMA